MIKSILAGAVALTAIASPVSAENFTAEVGEATDIRRCPIGTDVNRGVCYNQVREYSVSLYVAKPIKWSTNRAYSIDCDQRVFTSRTIKGSVAREYCPIRQTLPTMYTL